ncbi:MAG: 4Fe-4S dicluster domain-containing protein [bacterium]
MPNQDNQHNTNNNPNLNQSANAIIPNYRSCDSIEITVKPESKLKIKQYSGMGKKEQVQIDIVVNYCKGCELCVAFCPEEVLAMNKEVAEVIDISRCTKCNICEYLCPDFSISVE